MLWKSRQDTSYLSYLMISIRILIIIVLIPTWSRYGSSRSIVTIYGRCKIGCRGCNRHKIRIRSRVAGRRCRFVATCKDSKSSIDHAIRGTCIMYEIIQCLPFKYVICLPLLICGVLRCPIITVRRTGYISPAALKNDSTVVGRILDGTHFLKHRTGILAREYLT